MTVRVSRPGRRDNRLRLVWTKYYKYTVEDKEFFFKEKAYATYSDGWIDSQTIKKQTYQNAIRRGANCIAIFEENISEGENEHLQIIFSQTFKVSRDQVSKFIKNNKVSVYTEFKTMLLNQFKKDDENEMS